MSYLRRGARDTALDGYGNVEFKVFVLVGGNKEGSMSAEVVLELVNKLHECSENRKEPPLQSSWSVSKIMPCSIYVGGVEKIHRRRGFFFTKQGYDV